MLPIGVLGAFMGGVLSLLSPCSALLLPSFFAYAFQSRQRLLLHTLVFYFGLATLFVPLGLGIGWAARWVTVNRTALVTVAGIALIVLGFLELLNLGTLTGLARWLPAGAQAPQRNYLSTYSLGLVYGFAGVCSGPLLGAVLTFTAAAGNPWHSAGLLLFYALGMALPLFLLSSFWERFDLGRRPWLRGRPLHIGPFTIHSTRLLGGLLFIGLGWALIATGGTVALERFYTATGLLDLSFRWQAALRTLDQAVPATLAGLLLLFLMALLYRWSKRKRQP